MDLAHVSIFTCSCCLLFKLFALFSFFSFSLFFGKHFFLHLKWKRKQQHWLFCNDGKFRSFWKRQETNKQSEYKYIPINLLQWNDREKPMANIEHNIQWTKISSCAGTLGKWFHWKQRHCIKTRARVRLSRLSILPIKYSSRKSYRWVYLFPFCLLLEQSTKAFMINGLMPTCVRIDSDFTDEIRYLCPIP